MLLRADGNRTVLAEFYVEQERDDNHEQRKCHEYFELLVSASAFPAPWHIQIVAPEDADLPQISIFVVLLVYGLCLGGSRSYTRRKTQFRAARTLVRFSSGSQEVKDGGDDSVP